MGFSLFIHQVQMLLVAESKSFLTKNHDNSNWIKKTSENDPNLLTISAVDCSIFT